MRRLLGIFLFVAYFAAAQDKVFLVNGEKKTGVVVSVGKDFVFFRSSDTATRLQRIPKEMIVLVEKYDGKIMTFAKKTEDKKAEISNNKFYRNSFGIQPFGFMVGRIGASYEFLNDNGRFGIMPSLALTFDPVGVIYSEKNDTDRVRLHRPGMNAIGGLDLNFYIGTGEFEGFYFGPRIRYGTDIFMANIEGYSIQTQAGWRLGEPDERIVQHVSVGFGFVRILSSPAGNRINPKQSYGWGSINYRVAFKW